MVDAIRKTGARQVIVLNGLSGSKVWRRNAEHHVPKDPLALLAYDIHPFPTDAEQRRKGGSRKLDYYRTRDLDHWLDGWCDRHACIASAFFTGTGGNVDKGKCYDSRKAPIDGEATPAIARDFVEYFAKRQIGVLVFAGDWPYRLFDRPGHPGARLTSYAGFNGCSGADKAIGPGELLRATWQAQLRAAEVPGR